MKKYLLVFVLLFGFIVLKAQTHPEAHKLRGGDYNFLGFDDTADPNYPPSMQGWQGAQLNTQTSASTSEQPTGDEPLCTNCAANGDGSSINNSGINGLGIRRMANNTPGKPISIVLAINTIGCKKVSIAWDIKMIRPNDLCISNLALQYRIGTSGAWKNVADNEYSSAGGQNKSFPFYQLPAEIEGKPMVELRWYYYSVNNNTTMSRIGLTNVKVKAAEVVKIPVSKFNFSYDRSNVVFTDNSLNNPEKWLWKFGDGTTDSVQNPTHKYTKDSTYTVTLITENALGVDSIQKSVAYPNPDTTAVFADFDYSIDLFTVSFMNLSNNATSFEWDFGDSNVSTEQNPIHTYANKGTYTVKLVSTGELFSDTVEKEIILEEDPTGVFNAIKGNKLINSYPNPVNNMLFVDLRQFKSSELVTIEISNSLGQIVKSVIASGEGIKNIDMSGLNKGIYVLNIKDSFGILTGKIIKN